MPVPFEIDKLLHKDDFTSFDAWHHEGVGEIQPAPEGGMRLHCFGSRQGKQGCMAFFRPDLPDAISVEYDVVIRGHGGLMINYIAIRGLNGEDMIEDRGKLPERDGIMANYFSAKWGLQSYHVSVSRFNDRGDHTATSNWRRNPGGLLVGHGIDPCKEIDRRYHLRIVKDRGNLQLFVDNEFAHGFLDRDESAYPVPDTGKFGFRLIGSDALADVSSLRIHSIVPNEKIWIPWT